MKNVLKSKMFLRVTAVIAAVTLTMALFSGCGKKAVNDKDEQGRTVISVGSWPTKKGKTLDDMNARKATFEAENPDSVRHGRRRYGQHYCHVRGI